MSSGVFGSIRPAKIDTNRDVDIFYKYRPSRGENDPDFKSFKKVNNVTSWLGIGRYKDEANNTDIEINGVYDLKLPLDVFNKKGYYTVYITPRAYESTIIDVSVLAAYPNVKGVVFKTDGLPETNLIGYRIEFSDGTTRLIKSCNPCEPVIVNTGDGTPKTTRYNLNAAATNLVFCTVSPSSAPTFKPNGSPYIGSPGEEINLFNTKFSPKVIEIEAVNHDIETLSYMLEGDQATDRDNGIITTYNSDKEIYHQADYYVLKDELGRPRYNVKERRNTIDPEQEHDKIFK